MEKDNINISVLVNHAHGFGSPNRRALVKKALQEDVDLRIRYEGILQLMNDYPDKDPEELLDNMAAKIKRQAEEPVPAEGRLRSIPVAASHKTSIIPVWVKWAAAILVVVLTVPVYYMMTQNNRPQQLAREIADAPYSIENEKGGSSRVSEWKEDFKKEDYAGVISNLATKDSLSHEEQFYLGLSYLKTKPARLDDAQAAFQKAAASGILFRSDAWLYLGVTQVLHGRAGEAQESLQRSDDPQAARLLARLRK